MTDVTPEVLAELMRMSRKMEINIGCQTEEKENFCPGMKFYHYHHHHNNNNKDIIIDNNNILNNNNIVTSCNNSTSNDFLVVVDARPFQSLGDAILSISAQSHPRLHGDLSEVSLVGSFRVHYPNLLRKRSKGKMTLENVIVDKKARSLVSTSPTNNDLSSSTILQQNLSSFPEISTTTPLPLTSDSRIVVVYDQNTASVSELLEDCDAKLALKTLSLQCNDDVRICFLMGGLERFHNLFPDLCTPRAAEPPNEMKNNIGVDSINRKLTPPTREGCDQFISPVCVADKSPSNMDLPCQLLPWLFLGSQSHASSQSTIQGLGITALLNVAAIHLQHSPALPIRSAPVQKLPDSSNRFPFPSKAQEFSDSVPDLKLKKVPSHVFLHKEHRFRSERKNLKKGFYFKPNSDQYLKGTQTLSSNSTNELQVLNLPIADNLDTEISLWFDLCNSFIEKIRSERGRVLVHCQAGISRSATICLAYLLWSQTSRTLNEAFEFVRSRRSVVAPNFNFLRQLKDYEASLLAGKYHHQHHHHHLPFDRVVANIHAPSSLPSEIHFHENMRDVDMKENNVLRFTFDQSSRSDIMKCSSAVFVHNKKDMFLTNTAFDQKFCFDGSNSVHSSIISTNFSFPPEHLSFKGSCSSLTEEQIPKSHFLSESLNTNRCCTLENIKQNFREIHHSRNDVLSEMSSKDIKPNPGPVLSGIAGVNGNHGEFSKNCRPFKITLSRLYKMEEDHRHNHFLISWLRRIHRPRLILYKLFHHHHNHHHHRRHPHRYHNRHHSIHHRRSHLYPSKELHQESICSEAMFYEVNDDVNKEIYVAMKFFFILIMAIAIVFLVEKKHLL